MRDADANDASLELNVELRQAYLETNRATVPKQKI
jgi:hypothetical protein